MPYDYFELRRYIGELFKSERCGYINNKASTLDSIFDKICKTYRLTLYSSNDNLYVRGENGYQIITDSIYIIRSLECARVIQFYAQGGLSEWGKICVDYAPNDINYSANIIGDTYEYIVAKDKMNIWISPEIYNFVKRGFVSEEISHARRQTQMARWTFIVSVMMMFIGAISDCHTCRFNCSSNVWENMRNLCSYYDYSTVNWERIDTLFYRPNEANWSESIQARIRKGFPPEIAAEYWHCLQNAKTDFHQQSMPVRLIVSNRGRDVLDQIETMFDSVFVRCVEQEYYMRLFPDMYNEVMQPAMDNLFQQLSNVQ